MTQAIELLPCPFCGSEMHPIPFGFAHPNLDDDAPNCPLDGMTWRSDVYIDQWNTRAALSALTPDWLDITDDTPRNKPIVGWVVGHPRGLIERAAIVHFEHTFNVWCEGTTAVNISKWSPLPAPLSGKEG